MEWITHVNQWVEWACRLMGVSEAAASSETSLDDLLRDSYTTEGSHVRFEKLHENSTTRVPAHLGQIHYWRAPIKTETQSTSCRVSIEGEQRIWRVRSYSSRYNFTAIRPILGSRFIGNFLPTHGYWKRFETCDKFFRKRKFLQQRRHSLSTRKINFLKSKKGNGCKDKQEIHFGINSQSLLETSASSFSTSMPVSFETECSWVEKVNIIPG